MFPVPRPRQGWVRAGRGERARLGWWSCELLTQRTVGSIGGRQSSLAQARLRLLEEPSPHCQGRRRRPCPARRPRRAEVEEEPGYPRVRASHSWQCWAGRARLIPHPSCWSRRVEETDRHRSPPGSSGWPWTPWSACCPGPSPRSSSPERVAARPRSRTSRTRSPCWSRTRPRRPATKSGWLMFSSVSGGSLGSTFAHLTVPYLVVKYL